MPGKRSKNKRVRVTVSGEFIMNCARQAFLGEEVDNACSILSDSLPLITSQDVHDVLDGKKRLSGDSSIGVSVVDEYDNVYRASVEHLWAGRFLHEGSWMRPATTAEGHGRKHIIVDDEVIVFEPCTPLPSWWVASESAEESVSQFLAHGHKILPECAHAYEADYEAEWEEKDRQLRAEYQRIADEVRKHAADDVFPLVIGDKTVTVPRAPFWNWALRRVSNLKHLAPKWAPFSPQGLKLYNDDPYHSDWMLGAGLDLSQSYDHEVNIAAWDAAFELQESLANFEAAVVVQGHSPLITGVVGEGIRVVPHLGVEYAGEMATAQAIITEQGGAMAHMAVLALERGLCILRVPDARTRYLPGMKLALFPAEGRIQVVALGLLL